MRTSLNNIKQTEDYLSGLLPVQDALLFGARLLINAELADEVHWHKQTLSLVHKHGRNNLRGVIENVHQKLFTQPAHQSFKQKILQLFK